MAGKHLSTIKKIYDLRSFYFQSLNKYLKYVQLLNFMATFLLVFSTNDEDVVM